MDLNIVEIIVADAQLPTLVATGIPPDQLEIRMKSWREISAGVRGVKAYATASAIASLTALGFAVTMLEDSAGLTARFQAFADHSDADRLA